MIHFIVPGAGTFTLDEYFSREPPELVARFHVLRYEELPAMARFARGTYVLAGLDQLAPGMLRLVAHLHARLSASDEIRILNDPARWRGRYHLLRVLHAEGRNDFQAYRITEDLRGMRYPVFLRGERSHGGNLSPLANSPGELEEAVGRALVQGHPRDDLLAVEFNSTVDPDGLYRKYAAFRVGNRIMARSLYHSRKWMVKFSESEYTAPLVLEERAYVRDNPHADQLAEIFDLARIDYGQIDYSLKAGRIQTWEINVHPTIGRGTGLGGGPGPQELRPIRSATREYFFDRFREAWAAVDMESGELTPVEVHFDPEMVRAATPARRRGTRLLDTMRAALRPIKSFLAPVTRRALRVVGLVARKSPTRR